MAPILLSIVEAAELCGLETDLLEHLIKNGRGPAITRLSWKNRRISIVDLEDWLLSRRQLPGEKFQSIRSRIARADEAKPGGADESQHVT